MNFQSRKQLGDFLHTSWCKYAVQRTGVAMPNCFTYATARVSEIINRNQSLDGTCKVRGAGDLWETHASEFTQSKYAAEGALAIWKGGMDNFGHVAVIEGVKDTNICIWSQSNYGGSMFEVITRNPNGYAGMQFMGYLIHKDLPKVSVEVKPNNTTTAKPSNNAEVLNYKPSDWIAESATFTCTVDKINIRRAPSTKGTLTGDWYEYGMSFRYDGYVRREGYVWCSYIGKDNTRRWIATGEVNSKGINIKPYGTYK